MNGVVRYVAIGVAAWGCLGLGAQAGAQSAAERFKEFQKRQKAIVKKIEKWEDDEFKVIFRDLEGLAAELRQARLLAKGFVLPNNNAYKEAVKALEEARANHERIPEHKRTPMWNRVHVEILLRLGLVYALMSERKQGREVAYKAAAALARLDAGEGDEPLQIRGRVEVGMVLYYLERPLEAVPFIDEALARCERYARQRTPDRLALLATCRLAKAIVALSNGDPRAESLAQEVVKALRTAGNPGELAAALGVLGAARVNRGEAGDALKILREADSLQERAFPQGSPARAELALTLAATYQQLGQPEQALVQVGRAQRIWDKLFPKKDFENGHPELILALKSLGDALEQLGRNDMAKPQHLRAWELSQAYYPGDHQNKLVALLGYAHSLWVSRTPSDPPAAFLGKFQEAVAMGERLYGLAGHPNLALGRVYLGTVLAQLGRDRAGDAFAQFRAAAFYYRLRYRSGHPQAAIVAQLQGDLYRRLGDRARAAEFFRQALELDQRLLRKSTRNVADAEAFALGQQRQDSYHAYLSASRDLPAAEQGLAYVGAWHAKGAVMRLLAERRAVRRLPLGQAGPVPGGGLRPDEAAELSQTWEELLNTEARLARLLNNAHEEPGVREVAMNTLEARQLELQRDLARRVPAFRRQDDLGRRGPEDLARVLPRGSVFVDIIRYEDIMAGAQAAPRYAAFVLTPQGEPLREELGPATPIDAAVKEWRTAVTSWDLRDRSSVQRSQLEARSDAAGLELRRLVWEPIAAHLPTGTKWLFLAPDGALAGLPFAALPGPTAHTALVEEYIIAYVPHGPFLLESLGPESPQERGKGPFLALGNVKYERHAALPGSLAAVRLAQRVAVTRPAITLEGELATPGALRRELPHAGDALIETHAFYQNKMRDAEEERRLAFIRDWPPPEGLSAPRVRAPTARSPLIYTGLILAREGRGDELSGSLIAELSLEKLRSAFLPDCDTGVGEYLPGEGVQSLQEAFHLAGCPNVIASLWKVPDAPTEALVASYYDQLWDETRSISTPEALCLAQRDLYHNPRKAGVPADERGLYPERSHPMLWAGLIHSGIGR